MTKNAILKKLRKFHKWPGIVITLFVILFSLSGIFMNHRDLISAVDINRVAFTKRIQLPKLEQGSCQIGLSASGGDSALVYGNIGVWLTTNHFKTFQDWNAGFPAGTDNRKISKILKTTDGETVCRNLLWFVRIFVSAPLLGKNTFARFRRTNYRFDSEAE